MWPCWWVMIPIEMMRMKIKMNKMNIKMNKTDSIGEWTMIVVVIVIMMMTMMMIISSTKKVFWSFLEYISHIIWLISYHKRMRTIWSDHFSFVQMIIMNQNGDALLPSGSPFGSPGSHGDLFQFWGPQKIAIFFQGPHFLYFSWRMR